MGKKTIKKRIHELATRAINEIPSPVAYMIHTANDCGVSRKQMQAFLKHTREDHKKDKKPFGYICTTEQTPHGFHYHGIAFVSDRNYGLPIRFGAMLKARWHSDFPESKPIWIRDELFRLNSQLAHFLDQANYLDKKPYYPDLAKSQKRYWSSSTFNFGLPETAFTLEDSCLGESRFDFVCSEAA